VLTLIKDSRIETIYRLCKGRGLVANVNKGVLTACELDQFQCSTAEDFVILIKSATIELSRMIGIETEVTALRCALSIDEGQETMTLLERREEFLLSETKMSMRTLMRKEQRGVGYLIQYLERI
jgi:hypothetical protein